MKFYQIKPAKIKGKLTGHRVYYYGDNGEVLTTSEVLTSITNAKKNIRAMIKICGKIAKLNLFK